jgi:hypothetical protein
MLITKINGGFIVEGCEPPEKYYIINNDKTFTKVI